MLLDAASEGLHVIVGMLIVGLIFLGVIIVGETFHWLGARRKTRRAARTQY